MKTKSKSNRYHLGLLAVALSLGFVFAIPGCGSNGPDTKAQAMSVENAKTMRSYFDKANGDYAQLSEADKAAFVKLCGGEAKAEQNWNLMKNGPSAAPRTPEAPATGTSGS